MKTGAWYELGELTPRGAISIAAGASFSPKSQSHHKRSTTIFQKPNPDLLLRRLTSYAAQSLRPDFMAGITVAMVAVPQSMAYASIAGMPPMFGLFTAIIPTIVGACYGSSRQLVTGPTNALALVTLGVMVSVAGRADYVEMVFALALVSGLIQLTLGLLRLGTIIRFVSNSVLTGFLTGASLLIFVNQLSSLLGLPHVSATETPFILMEIARNLHLTNPYVTTIAVLTVCVLIGVRRINKKLPAPLLAIVTTAVFVQWAGWSTHGVKRVSDLGSMTDMTLLFHIPQLDLTSSNIELLLTGGIAVAILGLVEAMSVAKSIALSTGQSLDASREFVGQGLASLASGFFRGIPPSGSLSRSAVNFSSGAQTRNAGILSGLFVFLAMLVFAQGMGFIPTAALAGIVVVAAARMIDVKHIKLTWWSHVTSRTTFLVTLVATLLLPLHYAIYLGVVLSIGLYLYESSNIRLSYLIEHDGQFTERGYEDLLKNPVPIAIIHVEGALYFGAADELERRLEALFQSGTLVVILRLRRVHLLASTGIVALERIAARAQRNGTRVILCGVRTNLVAALQSSGVVALLGQENVIEANDTLFESTRAALARAKGYGTLPPAA